jgi:L-lactate dehydrogenase (cytochrome)
VTDTLTHPAWLWNVWFRSKVTFENFVGSSAELSPDTGTLWKYVNSLNDASVDWDDLDWFRSIWDGPLAIKGVMTGEDARRAVAAGVDAIIVSNHGGRQLDSLPSALDVLPEIVEAVGDRAEVILDGGVRRGTDVVKALALGAKACMIGRPMLYGLGAAGERGVERAVEILEKEIDRTLALLGRPTLADLDRTAVRPAGLPSRAPVTIPSS